MGGNSEEVVRKFESWMVKHGKSYDSVEEKEKRLEIFKANLKSIEDHNANPDKTYTQGLNHFADLTSDEFRSSCCGFRPAVDSTRRRAN